MASMAKEPGEARDPRAGGRGRALSQPPSARYVEPAGAAVAGRTSLAGPLARAAVVAIAGAALLVVVGAILASTTGLLFVSGVMGAGIGLALARARLTPGGGPDPSRRRSVTWLAIGVALAGVAAADLLTWLIALREGGTLGLVDYLLATFGPFVPGVAIVASLTAAWGVGAGPIQR
jgi:hypothetical protein